MRKAKKLAARKPLPKGNRRHFPRKKPAPRKRDADPQLAVDMSRVFSPFISSLTTIRRGKLIEEHSDAELDAAVQEAEKTFGNHLFYKMLHGVDAYFERRKRRRKRRLERDYIGVEADPWGNS